MQDRKLLEKIALQEICACLYYNLADNIETATDDELRDIIDGKVYCEECS